MILESKKKLMIVDDSALIRRAIRAVFDESESVYVAAEAANGEEALKKIPEINPDVITLDINMPVMDGLTTLKHIMIRSPRPVIMCSTLTEEGADTTFDALKFGALDFVHKPSRIQDVALEIQNNEIIKKVSLAADVDMGRVVVMRKPKTEKREVAPAENCRRIIAAGTSEGGYNALLNLLPQLRSDLHASLISVIHSDPNHLDAFIRYLDNTSMVRVKRASDGDTLLPGTCYMASGSDYVTVRQEKDELKLSVSPAPFPDKRMAVNMLMLSLAETIRNNAAGIILSGAGEDGAEGMEEVYNSGGTTIVQDPAGCLCSEMARASIQRCRSHLVLASRVIAERINRSFGPA